MNYVGEALILRAGQLACHCPRQLAENILIAANGTNRRLIRQQGKPSKDKDAAENASNHALLDPSLNLPPRFSAPWTDVARNPRVGSAWS